MTKYSITIESKSPSPQNFYFFQKPAIYIGGQTVYTNSVGSGTLPAYNPSVTNQIQFSLEQKYYAGVQKQMEPIIEGKTQIGLVSQAEMELSTGAGSEKDSTIMKIAQSSLYLTPPVNSPGVQQGAFRITTEQFNPLVQKYNAGLSNINGDGQIVLSNFIIAEPNKNIDIQPVTIFYINTGDYQAGTVVNFTTSSATAAICDATSGKTNFKVTYNSDGSWTVS